jgi:hypothetical protein
LSHHAARRTATRTLVVGTFVTALIAGLMPAAPSIAASSHSADPASRVAPTTPRLIDAAVRRGEISEAQGALYLSYAFTAPSLVPDAFRSSAPWDGTLPLVELKATLDRLGDAPAAGTARALLRGPSFNCPNFTADKPQQVSTKHFYIQYSRPKLRGLTIGRYAAALEQTWTTEIARFGWAKPPRDPVSYPKHGRYPVRVERLGNGLYGYVSSTRLAGNNPATTWNEHDAVASCMVLNQDYRPFPGTPKDAMEATAAHEFNHSIQFGYGALSGFGSVTTVMVEGGATWMEDEVFDGANDNWNYLWPDFTRPMGVYRVFPYPYWVVFRAMTEPFGTGTRNGGEAIFQTFWEQISKQASTNLVALDKGFKANGSSLARAYHDASIALRFHEGCVATAAPYCLEEGPNYPVGTGQPADLFTLAGTDQATGRKIANDFALNWVGLPTMNGIDLTIDVTAGQGILRASVACLTGDTVTVQSVGDATLSSDATTTVNAGGCNQVSVVISNVKRTAPSPAAITRTTYTITTV